MVNKVDIQNGNTNIWLNVWLHSLWRGKNECSTLDFFFFPFLFPCSDVQILTDTLFEGLLCHSITIIRFLLIPYLHFELYARMSYTYEKDCGKHTVFTCWCRVKGNMNEGHVLFFGFWRKWEKRKENQKESFFSLFG